MKLHGNAALSLNQRRRLAERLVKQDWSLTARKIRAKTTLEDGTKCDSGTATLHAKIDGSTR